MKTFHIYIDPNQKIILYDRLKETLDQCFQDIDTPSIELNYDKNLDRPSLNQQLQRYIDEKTANNPELMLTIKEYENVGQMLSLADIVIIWTIHEKQIIMTK